jgi:hypothetical protein
MFTIVSGFSLFCLFWIKPYLHLIRVKQNIWNHSVLFILDQKAFIIINIASAHN